MLQLLHFSLLLVSHVATGVSFWKCGKPIHICAFFPMPHTQRLTLGPELREQEACIPCLCLPQVSCELLNKALALPSLFPLAGWGWGGGGRECKAPLPSIAQLCSKRCLMGRKIPCILLWLLLVMYDYLPVGSWETGSLFSSLLCLPPLPSGDMFAC